MPKAAVQQKDGSYAIVPQLTAGLVTPEVLRRIATVAERYQIPVLKLTGAARIALVGIKEADVDRVWEDLGLPPAPAVGNCVRSVKVCPGTAACTYALQDSLGLGMKLEERYLGAAVPGKFKIGVSGCPRNCAEAWVKDFGVFGKKTGFTVVLGGSAGTTPRLAKVFATGLSGEEVIALCGRVLAVYGTHGKERESFGALVERLGIEEMRRLTG
jgi:NAD(P)H-nitrite reductase large subunit